MKNRVKIVDFAKGIGVVLMIIGHMGAIIPDSLHSWIYLFHMPLFFFLSGIFAKTYNTKKNLVSGLKHKMKRLLLPYYFYVFLFYVVDLLIGYRVYSKGDYINTFLGTDSFGFLWFIFALFFVEICFDLLYMLVENVTVQIIIIACLAILANILCYVDKFERIGSIFFSIGFYYIGYCVKERVISFSRNNFELKYWKDLVILLFITTVGVVISTYFSGNSRLSLDLHKNQEIDIVLTYVFALAGIGVTLIIAKLFENTIVERIIAFIGMNSLIIYPLFSFFPLRIEFLISNSGFIYKIISKSISFIICLLVIAFKKYKINKKL